MRKLTRGHRRKQPELLEELLQSIRQSAIFSIYDHVDYQNISEMVSMKVYCTFQGDILTYIYS